MIYRGIRKHKQNIIRYESELSVQNILRLRFMYIFIEFFRGFIDFTSEIRFTQYTRISVDFFFFSFFHMACE